MAGRKRIPSHILEFGGNDTVKLSKKNIELRKGAEIHLGGNVILEPANVAADPVAHKKWIFLAELYDGFKFVTSADTGVFEQYCLAFSEYEQLVISRAELLADHKRRGVPSYVSAGLLIESKISTELTKKSTLLQQLGGKLYLDPASRVKAIPIPKDDKKPADPLDKFGAM